jgi:predicted metalloprotease with PDZ domain
MGPLPGKEYHFLFQITPQQSYHGVEHLYSTVITLGPEKDLFEETLYEDLLGVSSHELFHAWNVKWMRPSDMLPYEFGAENYSKLGWVYEGVTTWYGDLFLYRSEVFDFKAFKATVDEKLKKHFNNYGRFNYSVADSSFDTWLDGYVAGAPHRKTSIYTEGSLITFILDSRIRAYTNDIKSFDDVLRELLADAKQGKGYTKDRLLEILNSLGPDDHEVFFEKYIYGCGDYEPELRKSFERLGLDLSLVLDLKPVEHAAGIKLNLTGQFAEVLLVAPASPAEKAGLTTGDLLIAVNGTRWDLAVIPDLKTDTHLEITAFRNGKLIHFNLSIDENRFFTSRQISLMKDPGEKEKLAFSNWSGRDFPQ